MFRSGARWLARATLLVVTGLLSTRGVAAAVDEPSRLAQAIGVEITVRGSAEDLERIRSVIGPEDFRGAETRWLTREHWDLAELLGGGSEVDGVIVCWIDLSESGKARLYFADPRRQRFLLRELSLPDGLSDLGREAIAQVLSMSVAALLEDSRAGISRAEAARVLIEGPVPPAPHVQPDPSSSAPRPEPAELSTSMASIGAAPFYAVRLYSDEAAVVHGPGITLGWVSDSEAHRSTIGLSAQYEFSRAYVADSVGLRWSTVALRSSFELLSQIGRTDVSAGARAGLGVDFTHVEPRAGSREERVSLTAARTSTSLALSVGLAACSRLSQRLGACLQLHGDFYPTRIHYDLELADGRTRVFVPWRVRPGLSLAFVLR